MSSISSPERRWQQGAALSGLDYTAGGRREAARRRDRLDETGPAPRTLDRKKGENLLEAVRVKDVDPVVVFAGSSEEYGLVLSSEEQYKKAIEKYGTIFPAPERMPEVPTTETNPLRPMSPYAVSKVYGDYLMRNYWYSYGIRTVISRAFNHEGAGRGNMFVTSVATSQVMRMKFGELDSITIGNVNAFRDWSHVDDIIEGYLILAEKGNYGVVYNQGSMRTNSVMSYLLMSL